VGVVWTTRDFGEFSNAILVGNFRSGWIAAFNGFTHKFIAFVRNPDNSLMFIDGLWSLTFGNDATAGPANTLFFTAGINNETDGLFGTITPSTVSTATKSSAARSSPLAVHIKKRQRRQRLCRFFLFKCN